METPTKRESATPSLNETVAFKELVAKSVIL